jgi:hypothetical protein
MRVMKLGRIVLAALMLSSTIAIAPACAAPRGRVHVQVGPPPPPVAEVRVVAPRRGYIWVPGYHVWNGYAYAWRPGAWVRPPRARAMWVPPHWQRDRRGWYLVPGHWR